MASSAHTVAVIRRLRALGQLRPRRRMPRMAHPDRIAEDYFRELRGVVDACAAAYGRVHGEVVRLLEELRRREKKDARMDAGEVGRARALVQKAAKQAAAAFKPRQVEAVARKFGEKTADFNRAQLDKQIRAAIGVGFDKVEKPTRNRLGIFTSSNVELVKTIPDRYFGRLIKNVDEAFTSGKHPETFAREMTEEYDVSLNDARRIARDQIGKLNAQVNQDRQEALGATGFIWRTMNDSRVRDSHDHLNGESFEWDDLPIDEDSGEEISPGSSIMCRCYAEFDPSTITGLDLGDGD